MFEMELENVETFETVDFVVKADDENEALEVGLEMFPDFTHVTCGPVQVS